MRVTFTVCNTGTRPGVAAPQVYIQGIHKSIIRPLKEQKPAPASSWPPMNKKTVRVEIPLELLSFHNQ